MAVSGSLVCVSNLKQSRLDQPASGDTGGLFFPKAIQHTLVGLYLQQIVLAALLFFAKAFAQGVVIVVLIVVTAFYVLWATGALS